jgi:Family of unknown function (DUF6909)
MVAMALSKLHPEGDADREQALQPTEAESTVVEAVEVAHRIYTTLLRSSGEMKLRVLESSHKAMHASLHPLAASSEPDLGAFLYAVRRLPEGIGDAARVIMGQSAETFSRNGFAPFDRWAEVGAPGRRRRWYDDTEGTLAVLISSASDVDDLIPTLVAFQIEWNKLHSVLASAGKDAIGSSTPARLSEVCGGSEDDWLQLHEVWGSRFSERLKDVASRSYSLRIRMLGGTQVGYARVTRRWWQQVTGVMRSEGLSDRPLYFVSSNTHSLGNLVTGIARAHETEIADYVEANGASELVDELRSFRDGSAEGSWENFLYFAARAYSAQSADLHQHWRRMERDAGVINVNSRTALDVGAQVIALDRLDVAAIDSRLHPIDAEKLKASRAVIVNIDYPLGLAAYNILREVAETAASLRGVYILGKAATLNADVGDVMISSVVHDEHTRSTYWLDNAFSVSDIAPYLRFGSGLDNQRAVTVKGTFLQNRGFLDFFYREAFTVVEMEAGPYLSAIYEMTEPARYPVGEPVNFSKLPVDFGVIHYASDTPFTQARTLGARGLSYFGMDSTYASSVAILRRILKLEGALTEE